MGAGSSTGTDAQYVKLYGKLAKKTGLSIEELRLLNSRYKALIRTVPSGIHQNDISQNQDLAAAENPYLLRVFKAIPKNDDEAVSFEQFASTVAVFRKGAPIAPKIRFLFEVFDYNFNGVLDKSEVEALLKIAKPDAVEVDWASEATKLIEEIDPTSKTSISFDAFSNYLLSQPGIEDVLCLQLQ